MHQLRVPAWDTSRRIRNGVAAQILARGVRARKATIMLLESSWSQALHSWKHSLEIIPALLEGFLGCTFLSCTAYGFPRYSRCVRNILRRATMTNQAVAHSLRIQRICLAVASYKPVSLWFCGAVADVQEPGALASQKSNMCKLVPAHSYDLRRPSP